MTLCDGLVISASNSNDSIYVKSEDPEENTVIVSDFLNDDNKYNKNLAKQSL